MFVKVSNFDIFYFQDQILKVLLCKIFKKALLCAMLGTEVIAVVMASYISEYLTWILAKSLPHIMGRAI